MKMYALYRECEYEGVTFIVASGSTEKLEIYYEEHCSSVYPLVKDYQGTSFTSIPDVFYTIDELEVI